MKFAKSLLMGFMTLPFLMPQALRAQALETVSIRPHIDRQEFINLLTSLPHTTAETSEAKAAALNLFCTLFQGGNEEIKTMLCALADNLCYLLSQPIFIPHLQRNLLKIILAHATVDLTKATQQLPALTPCVPLLTTALWTACNAALTQTWRTVGTIALWVGGTAAFLGLCALGMKIRRIRPLIKKAASLPAQTRQNIVNHIVEHPLTPAAPPQYAPRPWLARVGTVMEETGVQWWMWLAKKENSAAKNLATVLEKVLRSATTYKEGIQFSKTKRH